MFTKIRRSIYLGFDKDTIRQTRIKLDTDNLKTLKNISLLVCLLLGVIIGFYAILENDFLRPLICAVSILALILVHIKCHWMLFHGGERTHQRVENMLDFFSALCFAVAIYLGTFGAGGDMAVAIVWMFFFISLTFNRMPTRNGLMLLLAYIAFLVCSYFSKDTYTFCYDAIHGFASVTVSFFMSWSKSRMKIENIMMIEKLNLTNRSILDTVENQQEEAKVLRRSASQDELTGLLNKKYFEQQVVEVLRQSPPESCHALICIDIDNFKLINDKAGHLFGDAVLRDVTASLQNGLVEGDLAGRFGGDEFVLLLKNLPSPAVLQLRVASLLQGSRKAYRVAESPHLLTLSMGVALFSRDGEEYEELFRKADEALYQVKRHGKSSYCFYGSAVVDMSGAKPSLRSKNGSQK